MNALLIKSLNLGVIDSALSWLIGAITTLLMWIVEWTIDLFVAIFAELLYTVALVLLNFVDFFQAFFNALCGMGRYWDASGTEFVNQDPILSLVTNDAVLQVFLALTIVAVIMLILTTIIAMIRTEYTTEGAKNTKGNIIGTALKSLAMFFIVPISCIFGIVLCSGVLKAVYNATAGGDGVSAGGMVWYAASYNANRLRTKDETVGSLDEKGLLADFTTSTSEDADKVALLIDNAFKSGKVKIVNGKVTNTDVLISPTDYLNGKGVEQVYTYKSIICTSNYYNLRNMNYIVLFIGGGVALYIMFIAAFGLILRLYKCTILFMISAPISALTPLDGGGTFKSWRKLMIGAVASAFAIVVAFNLVFLLIPVMSEINIFDPNNAILDSWNRLVNLIFVLTGLYSIKETSKWVAGMLGIEDPLAAGTEISGKVMGAVGKIASVSGNAAAAMGGKAVSKIASIKANKQQKLSEQLKEQGDDEGAALAQQRAERATNVASKTAGFAGKAQASGMGVIQKTMGQKFQKLDDFMGGTKMIYDTDDEGKPKSGLGALATKGMGKLYSGVTTGMGAVAGSAAHIIGSGVVGKGKGLVDGYHKGADQIEDMYGSGVPMTSEMASAMGGGALGSALLGSIVGGFKGIGTGFKEAFATPETDRYRKEKGTDGKTHYYKDDKEIDKKEYLNARSGNRWGIGSLTGIGGRLKEFGDGANGISHAANVVAGIKESEAHMQKVSELMKQASGELSTLLDGLIKKFQMMGSAAYNGGKLTNYGKDTLGADLMRVSELTGGKLTIQELAKGLSGPDAQKYADNRKAELDTTRKEFENFKAANIDMGGIHVEMMPGALKEALHSVFSGLNIEGANFDAQFEQMKKQLKQEFEKQRQEIEKEKKMINQLAVAIAKYGKRLNPGK